MLFLAIGLSIYSLVVTYQAGVYTEEVVLSDYTNGKWRIYDDIGHPIAIRKGDLSQDHVDWLLIVQDPKFYDHNGIDLSTPGAGLTTITQSIVKKLYFKEFNPGFKKLKQSLIARFVVDGKLTKDEQLEIFINSVYMGEVDGHDIYGLASSAQAYYKKEINQLTKDEYLSLIAMLIGPDQYSILTAPEKNRERVSRIKAVISGEYQPVGLTDVYYNRI